MQLQLVTGISKVSWNLYSIPINRIIHNGKIFLELHDLFYTIEYAALKNT